MTATLTLLAARRATSTLLLRAPSASALAARALSSSAASKPKMTLEQALTSNHLILSALESPAAQQQLQSVRATGDTLTKWQTTNAILVHATLSALPQLGYTGDANGLQGYSDAFAQCLRDASAEEQATLRSLNEQKWTVLLKQAFDAPPAPPIPLKLARDIVIDMVDALQDDGLLKQVEEARSGLASRLPEQERQHMVSQALVGVQTEVVARHGFTGDAGYAQAQVCLMEHATDAVVSASIAAATNNVYARAGIDLQAALRQAASGGK